MSSRHLSRSIALQSLFAWDFSKESNLDIEEIASYNIVNFAAGLEDASFIKKLAKGVCEKNEEIDKIIKQAAPEWPIEQIAIVDRNVLRIGLYELLFGDFNEVPPKVAINEAIELAKTFGGETSGRFVNGVLGTVFKEIGGDSRKEFTPEKKEIRQRNETLEKEILGGAVVYKKEKEKIKFALVHDIFGYWTLSKGRLEKQENLEEGIKREIKEELGIDINLKDPLGVNDYMAYDPKRGKILKSVTYYLAESENEELRLESSGGLSDAKWFYAEDLTNLNIYNDILPFLTKAIKILIKS